MKLPQRLPLEQMQVNWATAIDPVLSNPIVNGNQLKSIALVSGINSINHKLGRKPQGYLVTRMFGSFAQIYEITSQQPELTLQLNSSTSTMVDIYVY